MKWIISPDVELSAKGWPAIAIIACVLLSGAEAVLRFASWALHYATH